MLYMYVLQQHKFIPIFKLYKVISIWLNTSDYYMHMYVVYVFYYCEHWPTFSWRGYIFPWELSNLIVPTEIYIFWAMGKVPPIRSHDYYWSMAEYWKCTFWPTLSAYKRQPEFALETLEPWPWTWYIVTFSEELTLSQWWDSVAQKLWFVSMYCIYSFKQFTEIMFIWIFKTHSSWRFGIIRQMVGKQNRLFNCICQMDRMCLEYIHM